MLIERLNVDSVEQWQAASIPGYGAGNDETGGSEQMNVLVEGERGKHEVGETPGTAFVAFHLERGSSGSGCNEQTLSIAVDERFEMNLPVLQILNFIVNDVETLAVRFLSQCLASQH